MGLFSNLMSWPRRRLARKTQSDRADSLLTRPHAFEIMEPRRLLAASPITLGTVYIEEDLGSDLHGDHFEVQFTGGAPQTQLTRLVINGDRGAAGLSLGDVIFDTEPTGLGADAAQPFRLEQLITANPNARVVAHVNDGESVLTLDLYGFQAGDKLIFSIDVDEVQWFEPGETDVQQDQRRHRSDHVGCRIPGDGDRRALRRAALLRCGRNGRSTGIATTRR